MKKKFPKSEHFFVRHCSGEHHKVFSSLPSPLSFSLPFPSLPPQESDDPEAITKFLMGQGPQGTLAAASLVLPSIG